MIIGSPIDLTWVCSGLLPYPGTLGFSDNLSQIALTSYFFASLNINTESLIEQYHPSSAGYSWQARVQERGKHGPHFEWLSDPRPTLW